MTCLALVYKPRAGFQPSPIILCSKLPTLTFMITGQHSLSLCVWSLVCVNNCAFGTLVKKTNHEKYRNCCVVYCVSIIEVASLIVELCSFTFCWNVACLVAFSRLPLFSSDAWPCPGNDIHCPVPTHRGQLCILPAHHRDDPPMCPILVAI